jgi:hypothetical protein
MRVMEKVSLDDLRRDMRLSLKTVKPHVWKSLWSPKGLVTDKIIRDIVDMMTRYWVEYEITCPQVKMVCPFDNMDRFDVDSIIEKKNQARRD